MRQTTIEGKCLICGEEATCSADSQNCIGYFINCPICGKYVIEDTLLVTLPERRIKDQKLKSCMYYYLTQIRKVQRKQDTRTVYFVSSELPDQETTENNRGIYVAYNRLINVFPDNFNDQISMILVNLANKSGRIGTPIPKNLYLENMSHLFFLTDEADKHGTFNEISWWIKTLKEQGFIADHPDGLLLTFEGWTRAHIFEKQRSASKTAFVAMHFSSEMHPAREKIMMAIEASGFIPVIMDLKEHNNQIVPEILYEIRKSRFLVADFTNQRGGVYYEAGYAEGLGIPVIAMCCQTDFDNVHFDIRQKNTIFWSNVDEIQERLIRRISATVSEDLFR